MADRRSRLKFALLVGVVSAFVGCGRDWDAFGRKWRNASPDERCAMSPDTQAFFAEFNNAPRERVRQILGEPDFEGIEYGIDTMRYDLGIAKGDDMSWRMSIRFDFENDKVSGVFGNFVSP